MKGETKPGFYVFPLTFHLSRLAAPCPYHGPGRIITPMKVQLSHPARQIDVKGPKRVKELLRDLQLPVEAHLVIRGEDLVTEDEWLKDDDVIEVRPVISGGA